MKKKMGQVITLGLILGLGVSSLGNAAVITSGTHSIGGDISITNDHYVSVTSGVVLNTVGNTNIYETTANGIILMKGQ